MKKPVSLPLLLLLAPLAAFAPGYMLMSWRAETEEANSHPAQQRRAFAAAARAAESGYAADPPAQPSPAPPLSEADRAKESREKTAAMKLRRAEVVRAQFAADSPNAPHVLAARRHFLANPARWQEHKAREIAGLARHYQYTRQKWAEIFIFMRASEIRSLVDSTLKDARGKLDVACTDLAELTPEAWEQLDLWETTRWKDYALPKENLPLVPDTSGSPAPPEGSPAADHQHRRNELAWQLLFQYEASLEHKDAVITGPLDSSGPFDNTARYDSIVEVEIAGTAPARILWRLDTHILKNADRLRDQWAARNWEGYVIGAAPVDGSDAGNFQYPPDPKPVSPVAEKDAPAAPNPPPP